VGASDTLHQRQVGEVEAPHECNRARYLHLQKVNQIPLRVAEVHLIAGRTQANHLFLTGQQLLAGRRLLASFVSCQLPQQAAADATIETYHYGTQDPPADAGTTALAGGKS
jgi:hypothetical protein